MRQNYIPPHYIICIELLFISSFDNFFNHKSRDKPYRNIYRALYESVQTYSAEAEFLRQRRQREPTTVIRTSQPIRTKISAVYKTLPEKERRFDLFLLSFFSFPIDTVSSAFLPVHFLTIPVMPNINATVSDKNPDVTALGSSDIPVAYKIMTVTSNESAEHYGEIRNS